MSTTVRWVAVGIAISVSAVVSAVVLLGLLFPPGQETTPTRISLSIEKNATTGLYGYVPASVHVPEGTLVEFTITNFDPENHTVSAPFCLVNGTFGGRMAYMMEGSGMGFGPMRSAGSLAPGGVSHTFTISSGGVHLNVPLPPAAGPSAPSVVTFTWLTPGPGEVVWHCEAADPEAASGGMGGMMGELYSG